MTGLTRLVDPVRRPWSNPMATGLIDGLVFAETGTDYDIFAPAPEPCPHGTYPGADKRHLEWWRAGRFGMFVHWNMSSVVPCKISWAMDGGARHKWKSHGTVPMPDYEQLYLRFNPVNFNAAAWVDLARAAGMKYLLYTTKHHDSFAMWDTAQSDYKITRSPYGRDVCRQVADACHAGGVKLGWYYSPADWHHPAARARRWGEYTAFMQAQLRELMTGYGQVDILFFDYWQACVSDPSWPAFYQELRRRQPQYLHNRNTPWYVGDIECYEMSPGPFVDVRNPSRQKNPERFSRMTLGDPWETCHSLEGTWSYQGDVSRGSKWIVQLLVRCAGCDGNLLLNATPDSQGQIPPSQQRDLREAGAWLGRFGQSIYGTRGGPIGPLFGPASSPDQPPPAGQQLTTAPTRDAGQCVLAATQAGRRIFLHVLSWPANRELMVPPMAHRVTGATLLTGGQVAMRDHDGRTFLFAPPAARDAVDTLIALDLSGPAIDIDPCDAAFVPCRR